MGLFQNLVETYERCSEAIGNPRMDKDGNINEKKTLLPIFHTTFPSEICITIDEKGRFIRATRDKKATPIIIPCTEKSLGRSSGIVPHPLCDQVDYVGGINEEKEKAYLKSLGAWKGDNIALNAVYTYVSSKTLIEDLIKQSIFKDSEYKATTDESTEKQLDKEKIRKFGVRFSIQSTNDVLNVWENKDIRNLWIDYIYGDKKEDEIYFDYLSGEKIGTVATQHPKNINSLTGNAKLISSNDGSGFTFRGRFEKPEDALIIDYLQSQKMHQMLRWLIANFGYAVDTQVIVTWAVDNDVEVKEKAQSNSVELFSEKRGIKTEADVLSQTDSQVYADYSQQLKKLLQGYGNIEKIKKNSRKICIAVFDAATTGRMGLVFYQEFTEDKYLESIANWHIDTSYYLTAWKKTKDENGKDKDVLVHYIGAPSYKDIITAVYGKSRGDKSYAVLEKKMRKQLLECMFGNFGLPKNMVEMATNRASNPMSFTNSQGQFDKKEWTRSTNITCALVRNYYKQQKEEIKLELELKRTDRDYLFGRLLSIADNMESYALYKAGVKRPTNAVKLMSAFQIKPYSTWLQLYTQLIPYRNQLDNSTYYQAMIDEVMVLFEEDEFENNTPLSPLYLLGYSAQNRAFFNKNKKNNMEVNEDDINTK